MPGSGLCYIELSIVRRRTCLHIWVHRLCRIPAIGGTGITGGKHADSFQTRRHRDRGVFSALPGRRVSTGLIRGAVKRILRALSSLLVGGCCRRDRHFRVFVPDRTEPVRRPPGQDRARLPETENIARVLEAHSLAAFQKIEILLVETAGDLIPDDLRGRPERTSPRVEAMNRLLKSRLAQVPEAGALQVANEHGDYVFSSLSRFRT